MPLDIDEILRQKKAAGASRPRFVPRAERERLAAEKAKKEEAEQERKRHDQQKRHVEQKETVTAKRSGDEPSITKQINNAERKPTAQEIEDEILLTRYLGPQVNVNSKFSTVKKRQRMAGKRKFNESWDPSEDTTRYSADQPTARRYPANGPLRRATQPVTIGNQYDEAAEELALQKAVAIEERDLENGRERAKAHMDAFYSGRAREERRWQKRGLGQKWSDKALEDMTERDWRIFKDDFAISTKGGGIPNPMRNWNESNLPRRILDIVDQVGYTEPSAIQRAAIPVAMQARDLIGVAVTGSGKTAAFLLPLLVYILDLPPLTDANRNDGPYALIIAPTRELVQQIEGEAKKFAEPLGFRCVSLIGGRSLEEQAYALRNGAEIVVATPGRLVDCIERRLLVFSQCCYLVMDEADRMIDMGFEEPVNKILDALPITNEKPDTEEAEDARMMQKYLGGASRYRQTMMFTATMPPPLEKIAKKYLRRPAIVTIGTAGEAVETVEQRVEFQRGEERRNKRLQDLLGSGEFGPPVIVFVNTKRQTETVARVVKQAGWSVVTLSSSKTQEQREAALLSIRDGRTQVLVATDVAGRGIDVADVSLVVNFNMAGSIEAYTHRIGRTGRAGRSGVAVTFLGDEDTATMYDLRQMLSKSAISKVPEELKKHAAAQTKPARRA
ncbi:DEAD-domain-containing protein [Sarocladium strictum]